ncbi:hypothetical protein P2G88_15900 [Aliiglaciecola sp. CAU 1673]|uniref:hypothetical protein n=1 Tax=Aliiglaciecola sp. CAU 1673 TaxID=3032595 RepID=UPI0023D9DEE6|nr:hypothetical protein [Aliiglaciecola sp. CAU 1673]MDF2179735.1 hypothetical protein [Aliiglaciecola sp. CAU 1673]
MKPVFRSVLLPVVMAGLLSSCATGPGAPAKKQIEALYLRGVFTWWEADERFLMQPNKAGVYQTEAELIADGQPYDFRFADKAWSKGSNCGYANKQDEKIKLGIAVQADCDTANNNFKFTPKRTGVYQFTIDFSKADGPWVSVLEK